MSLVASLPAAPALPLNPSPLLAAEDYVESFRPALMDAVYQWSKGASFGSICGTTDIFEGSIIR